jgi:hypothetical protein
MVFAVVGIEFKSELPLVEGSSDSGRYIQNLDGLGFIGPLNEKYRPFGWIFEQDRELVHAPRFALDLSRIKVLCAILNELVSRINPRTIDQLKRTLLEAWDLIP